jgi:hypothetical protein
MRGVRLHLTGLFGQPSAIADLFTWLLFPAVKSLCQNSGSQRPRREIGKGLSNFAAIALLPEIISRFQRLRAFTRSHLGRWPRLLHFAPLALEDTPGSELLRYYHSPAIAD